jgi:cytidylate kinase
MPGVLAVNSIPSSATAVGVSGYIQANAYLRARPESAQTATKIAPAKTLTIAISREAGIDAAAYARTIGHLLGWSVWDHELLELVAARLGATVRVLETLDERHISWIQESIEAFLLHHAVNQHAFALELREVLDDLAAQGNCVIVGRGAPHILPPRTTLKVRLVAAMGDRVAAFRSQMGLEDAAQAAREVQKLDRERARFVREHFHKDPLDPAAYDVVLNTSHYSPAECARIVQDLLKATE